MEGRRGQGNEARWSERGEETPKSKQGRTTTGRSCTLREFSPIERKPEKTYFKRQKVPQTFERNERRRKVVMRPARPTLP